jgi:hypothetical protein
MSARSEIGDDAPLRRAAPTVAYPDGSMTASGLQREAAKVRLVIAGKDSATPRVRFPRS